MIVLFIGKRFMTPIVLFDYINNVEKHHNLRGEWKAVLKALNKIV